MRNKKLMLATMLLMGALAFSACSDKKNAASNVTPDVYADVDMWSALDYKVEKYVTLGEYKGLEVNYPTPSVSDEDVSLYASDLVYEYTEYNDVERAAELGDSVNIDYVGTYQGEEFDGGSDSDYDIVLGDGEFLEEFENAIVGKKAGETTTFNLTFPEDYDEELGGKEVEFTVTVNYVCEVVEPEYTDAFVAEVTEFDSIAAYEASVRAELEATAETDSAYMAAEDAFYKAVENATVEGYPQKIYDACYIDTQVTYESYAEMFGMEFDEFMADFMGGESLESVTESVVQEFLVTHAIAKAEGFELTEKNYKELALDVAKEYEYDTVEDFEADYGMVALITTVYREKALDILYDNAVLNEVSEDEYYGEQE